MRAICFRGPAGVGKTTLAYAVGRVIAVQNLKEKTCYISADMFAHISMDCTYTEDEIDLKYTLMRGSIAILAQRKNSIIFDDTFNRYADYVSMIEFLSELGFETFLFNFVAPLEVALSRNQSRFWKERIDDSRVRLLHGLHSGITHDREILINTLLPIEDNCNLILREIEWKR